MRRAFVGLMLSAILAIQVVPARAVDLDAARQQAGIVAEALARGAKGDWSGAEATARKSADVLVHDIVLWRKLRAGQGSVLEYQSFVTRRGTFPGIDILTEVVLGQRPAPAAAATRSPALSDEARARLDKLSELWQKDKFDEAEKLLVQYSTSAAVLGDPARWADRRARLVRRAAREGRGALAYTLASRHFTTAEIGYEYSDLEWLAGWVALRQLNQPDVAIPHFQRFLMSVETPISLGRGHYWLGRAFEAKGDTAAAQAAYARGAEHQTSFYGQLAAERAGVGGDQSLASATLPDPRVVPVTQSDDARAMAILELAGEGGLAWQMFVHKAGMMNDEREFGALGQLALELGKPDYAVRVAKMAARKGHVVPAAYYPVIELAHYVTQVEPALAMSIARQETELNHQAISHAGARGLMQIMPGTAQLVAGQIGEPYSPDRLIQDWRYNVRLGQSYLAQQINRFDGSYALAAAAYNAGPHRVDRWIAEYGDPRRPGADLVDWIEHIPFSETRNYVQRVMEGVYVYRTRLSGRAGPMTISGDLQRGLRS
ncbi:MAG TPA: lytic transglycosylase domain-containing protein [Thermohalobaculum sp.]|nr:lytic transglycosylase domain-containing protein [Thermohalobaculum sp.]